LGGPKGAIVVSVGDRRTVLEQAAFPIAIVEADLTRPEHVRDVVTLTEAYALDPMGNGGPLAPEVVARLIAGLRDHPTTLIFLAYAGGEAVGIATCFRGFSTFQARPLINIHDLAVLPAHRGRGVGPRLLAAVERKARDLGCCRLTLEVLENNGPARRVYAHAGFGQMGHAGHHVGNDGGSLFYVKPLDR
jgi:GNAT superfamily N-acetyltransferase